MIDSLQSWNGCFNSGRVISVSASLPNNVNTSKSISTLLIYSFAISDMQTGKQLSQVAYPQLISEAAHATLLSCK